MGAKKRDLEVKKFKNNTSIEGHKKM